MEKRKPPFRIVAPGRVYRRDDIDATHSMIFHQIEILAIEEKGKLTLGDLKGTVEYFLQQMFGPTIEVQFRGSFFPFKISCRVTFCLQQDPPCTTGFLIQM